MATAGGAPDPGSEQLATLPTLVVVGLATLLLGRLDEGSHLHTGLSRYVDRVLGTAPEQVEDPAPTYDAAPGRQERLERWRSTARTTRAQAALAEATVRRYERYDAQVMRAAMVAGFLTLVLAVVGIVLAAVGYLPFGFVSGAVALLAGAGTVGLTQARSMLEQRLATARKDLKRHQKTLRSLEPALAIEDEDVRDARLRELDADAP